MALAFAESRPKITDSKRSIILVFDFGGQYAHLIGRTVREQGVYSELVPYNTTMEQLDEIRSRFDVRGIIFSGGPDSVYDKGAPEIDRRILYQDIPILGLCYGHQLIAQAFGGTIEQASKREFGPTKITVDSAESVLKGLLREEQVLMSHGDTVRELSSEWIVLAHTQNTPIAAFRHKTRKIFCLQFHPEVVETLSGNAILKNFLFDECECRADWKPENLVNKYVSEIKETVGNGKAVIALSGGVDSSVAAALAAKALGNNLVVVYVDTGFMRKGETEQVKATFGALGVDLRAIEAKDRFMKKLEGVTEPEEKRKIIGKEFARVFEEESAGAEFLVQGTIYPDRVESGKAGGKSAVIKTHHNVGGLPKDLKFKGVVEPLKDLYKDEVRRLAAELGLPESIVYRQPFPGPGLAIRVLGGPIREEDVDVEREADYVFTTAIESAGLARGLWQYFTVLLPEEAPIPMPGTDKENEIDAKANNILDEELDKSGFRGDRRDCFASLLPEGTMATGVKGDARAYGRVVLLTLRYKSPSLPIAGMEPLWDLIDRISTRITNEIADVTRVVYDMESDELDTVSLTGKGDRAVVMRALISREAMTARFAPLDWEFLHKTALELYKVPEIGYVMYDVTNKPPGTVEWE